MSQIRVVLQPQNMGKGAALRRGIQEATGDYVIIQDADLEYDPAEYPLMIEPLVQGKADVVFRFTISRKRAASRSLLLAFGRQQAADTTFQLPDQHQSFRHGNLLQGLPPRDHSVDPYRGKSFWIRARDHSESGTAQPRIYEVGISYWGRTYEEGKKIGWKDGVRALYCLLKYSLKKQTAEGARSAATAAPENSAATVQVIALFASSALTRDSRSGALDQNSSQFR